MILKNRFLLVGCIAIMQVCFVLAEVAPDQLITVEPSIDIASEDVTSYPIEASLNNLDDQDAPQEPLVAVVDSEVPDYYNEAIEQEVTTAQQTENEAAETVPTDMDQAALQALQDVQESIEFNFEEADITTLLTQISELFDVIFITDDAIDPLTPGAKSLKGNKISFKTHKALTKKAAWNIFLTFLDLVGFALVPEATPGIYRVVTALQAQKSPVPTYIGIDSRKLPDNDQVIRYVYFIENARIDTIESIVNSLKSTNAHGKILSEIRALVITDRAYNIRSLMEVIRELDQVVMPQAMSVLKLVNADASEVKALYDSITKTDESQQPKTFMRKQPTTIYFPENTKIIAEPRTNSLIIFGSPDAIQKIEKFITTHVDIELEKPYSPLHTYQLRYASAVTVADIMEKMSQFGSETAAGRSGGVRGGDKYIKPMSFTPEPATNTLVIKGDYEDYIRALEVIKKLDEPQPQVAVEALLLAIDIDDQRELGSQIRTRVPESSGLLGNNVAFQTSGIRLGGTPKGIVTNDSGPGSDRLLGNLINLVQNAVAGNTVVSLGADAFGVWGIFGILQRITNAQVVSNPFLVATNKTKSSVEVGQVRRVITGTVFAGDAHENAFGDFSAKIQLSVTPQINSDGMIVLSLNVMYENFLTPATDVDSVAKQTRQIDTRTIVADQEVIVIGGLIQNIVTESLTKVPILGDIPILGWLFKNKRVEIIKRNLMVLISTRIIEPEITHDVDAHTQIKLRDFYETVESLGDIAEHRDPVYKRFFENRQEASANVIEDFLFTRIQADKEDPEQALPNQPRLSRSERFRQERAKALKNLNGSEDGALPSRSSKVASCSKSESRDARRAKCKKRTKAQCVKDGSC